MNGRIQILRLTTDLELVSARVFEELFSAHLGRFISLKHTSLRAFLDAVLGDSGPRAPSGCARAAFRSLTADSQFLSVDHRGLFALPELALLRNLSKAPVRILIIAHAPGAYPLDLALLRPLLQVGDRIIAPTRSSRTVIEHLCPSLLPFTRVIPHPIGSNEHRSRRAARPRLAFLGRLVPEKAVHRVLDAHALLLERGRKLPLDIIGPVGTSGGEMNPYTRSLGLRLSRLGNDDWVRFHGQVEGDEKRSLLGATHILVNLSLTLEESFGKSVAEALTCGVPSVVTAWDGLPEVAGPMGISTPVEQRIFAMDVDPEKVADGIELLLDDAPSADDCREDGRRFHPSVVGPVYRQELTNALDELTRAGTRPDSELGDDEPAAPTEGLLGTAAPLTAYSWRDLYEAVAGERDQLRAGLAGRPTGPLTEGGHLRTRLFYAVRRPLEQLYAGLEQADVHEAVEQPRPPTCGGAFLGRIEAASRHTHASRASRVVCLDLLWSRGCVDATRKGIEALRSEGLSSPGMHYLEVELLESEGHVGAAIDACLAQTGDEWWDEHAAHRLTQLARLAVRAGAPERALPRLRDWTERFPDESVSWEVWLERSRCALAAGRRHEAFTCVRRVFDLSPSVMDSLKEGLRGSLREPHLTSSAHA